MSKIEYLRAEAGRCRRLADSISDEVTARSLHALADSYEEQAVQLETQADDPLDDQATA